MIRALLIWFLLLPTFSALAELSPITWVPEQSVVVAPSEVRFLREAQPLGIDAVLARLEEFSPLPEAEINFGNTRDTHWLRFDVANAAAVLQQRYLSLGTRSSNQLDVYIVRDRGVERVLHDTRHYKISERPVPARFLFAPLTLAAGERAQVYVRYSMLVSTRLNLELLTEATFAEREMHSNVVNSLLVGAVLTLIIFSLLQFLAIRQVAFFFYSCVQLAGLTYVLHLQNFGMAYIWPEHADWDKMATPVLTLVYGFFMSCFLYAFLQPKKHGAPLLDRAFQILFIPPICLGLSLAIFPATAVVKYVQLIMPLNLMFGLGLLVLSVWARIPNAGLLLFGWSFLIGGIVSVIVPDAGLIAPIFSGHGFSWLQLGVLSEAVVFAVALTNRTRALRDREEAASQQLIASLQARLEDSRDLVTAEQQREQAVLQNHEKGQLLAQAGHDIFQPLYSLRLSLDLLHRQHDNTHLAGRIDNNLDYIESLLTEIMGHNQDSFAPVNLVPLDEILTELEQRHGPVAKAAGVRLRVRGSSASVHGSRLVLMRILDNLVKNAIAYSPGGKVLVGVRRGEGRVFLQVLDNGRGMSAADIGNITEALTRVPLAQENPVGYGLGLFIVDALCRQSGYELGVASRLGQGSRFSVAIPTA